MNRPSGATTAATNMTGRTSAWLNHHRLVAYQSLTQLLSAWLSSLMTWLVIGIALALPTILYLMLTNIAEVSGDWDGKPRMSLYLQQHVELAQGQEFARDLMAKSLVDSASYIAPGEALAEFRRLSGFGDVLNSLDRNPLPGVIEIRAADADVAALRILASELAEDERVESIVFDLEWVERLFAMVEFGERLVLALGFVLSLGVLLVIGNTIRLAIENRRSEIEVVKLVGGTDGFVRRPFLYLGFWYGAGGALMGLLLVEISVWFLAGPVEDLAQSYRDQFALRGPEFSTILVLFGIGVVLGIFGALTAVGRHLREIEPK